ncbi:MAG: type II toxin-antitoxin system RelB/DinJ family antitoxin [Spirochaetaceae bacterium]|nr:type II toxin-antitoxin system RelB/DinJ family antitoxin [Spirochaetaceae bacterium]
MAQAMINFRMDADEKTSFENICDQLGISITAAFKMFTKKVIREKRIPFDVSIDPFYSESNMRHLSKIVSEVDSGTVVLSEHELIEAD